jgi:ankyrin repeat protein
LSKIKIFQNQSNETSFKQLIKKELQEACKASHSVTNSIYTKFAEGFSKWWKKVGNVEWFGEASNLWKNIEKCLIREVYDISEPELHGFVGYDIRFNQQHIQRLCDAVKQNTFLNIITNSNIRTLHKLKTYQALNTLGYMNSLFIGLKSLMFRRNEIRKLWPCKLSTVLVIDCDCDGNVADILLDILQQSAGCEQGSKNSDNNKVETLVEVLQTYQQKVVQISTRKHKNLGSKLREKIGKSYADYVDNCNISDMDEECQYKLLERTVNFQGTNVALQKLLGKNPPICTKSLVDSDVISTLLSGEEKLCVGRKLSDTPKYYVHRSLEHRVYLKDDIVKLTDNTVTLAVSGLQVDQLKKYLPAGEKICEFVYDEREKSHFFKIFSDFSKAGFSAEWKHMKSHHKIGEATKPEDVRYVILGDLKPENSFRKLKDLCTNVHWIQMEEGSFLWRESNCNIDIIRRKIDDTKYKEYDIKSVMGHKDKAMSLVAEPGMGKSTFLSYLEHEIKKLNPSVWIVRINLREYTRELENIEFEKECIDKCKTFLWSAAHSPEQDALTLVEKIFKQALEQTGKMVIILDGLDEISPDYSSKVERLIREIRDKTSSKIWVSSRFYYRQDLEDILVKLAFTLQPFTLENKIEFLEQYWNEVINIPKQRRLRNFAIKLLRLCSQNISDKDGEFTGIPLQIKMLGEAFMKEAEEYCSSGKVNIPEKFNLLDLLRKFTENKFSIYFSEKNAMDSSKPETKRGKNTYLEKHMVLALISLFSLNELEGLLGDRKHVLEQAQDFLHSGRAQEFGIISDITDEKPQFIHRCFAEYFVAKWFTANFRKCKDIISNTLFNSTYEVARNIFYRMLAEEYEMHGAVLNNVIDAVKEFLKQGTEINNSDKDGRTDLHLAVSYNSPVIQKLLTFPGADANKPAAVLIWTPLKYADRTKSLFAMDILLQNGVNADDIVLARRSIKTKEWGQTVLWESASKGHRKLLELMMDFGTDVNGVVEVPENMNAKITLLHRVTFCGQLEVIRLLVERKADINIRNSNKDTALHFAAESGGVEIIQLLVDKGMSVNLTNTRGDTPLHVSARLGNLEATKNLVEIGAALNRTNVDGNIPLMEPAYDGKSEVLRYHTEVGADTIIRNKRDKSAIHIAALSGSVDIIKYLLDQVMSVNFTNPHDDTPLHVSARCGNLDVTKNLVEIGAALNSINGNVNTPLMEGAYKGKSEVFRYVTEVGADSNIRNKTDKSTLHIAALSGSVAINKYLLDKGMSVKFTDKDGNTPLHVLATNDNLEATKALVERRTALNSADVNGDTQLMVVVYGSNTEQMGIDIKLLLQLFCKLLSFFLLICIVNASLSNIYCTLVNFTNETQNSHLCFICM